jgi:hypothetical protein
MEQNVLGNTRARAWILLRCDDPAAAAQTLWQNEGLQGGDSYVVVRADVVDYTYNVVVPVDCENAGVRDSLYQRIRRITAARDAVLIPVLQPVPAVPHDAEGFVSQDEFDRGHDKVRVKPGRQRWSPGINAWG